MEEKQLPKVSIVVPMYNVEQFASFCLKSILGQTYSNLEIIVVDDGSTDATLAICKTISGDDPRVKVLNKENGGLSSARNYGLRNATGNFVMFVDGDDLVDGRIVDYLVSLALREGVPLATCEFKKIESTESFKGNVDESYEIVSGYELLKKMLLQKGESGSACGKIYSKELFPLLAFPEGQLFEDFGVEAKIFSRVKKACVSKAKLYGYVSREGSITRKRTYGDDHLRGMISSLEEVRKAASDDSECKKALQCYEAICSLRVASKLDLGQCSDKVRAREYIAASRRLCLAVARGSLASKGWRIRCFLFAISPVLHNRVLNVYNMLSKVKWRLSD